MSSPFDIADEEAQIQSLERKLSDHRAQLLQNLHSRIAKLQGEVEQNSSHRKAAEQELAKYKQRLAESEQAHAFAAEQHSRKIGEHLQELLRLRKANEEKARLLAEQQQSLVELEATNATKEGHLRESEAARRAAVEQTEVLRARLSRQAVKDVQLRESEAARRAAVEAAEILRARLDKQAADIDKLKAGLQPDEATLEQMQLAHKAGLQLEEATHENMQLAQKEREIRSSMDVWAERICQLVSESRQRLYIPSVSWEWQKKWPEDAIDNFQPCKKMKSAVQNYVPGVRVTDDLEVVLVSGGNDAKPSAMLSLRSRSRSSRRIPPGLTFKQCLKNR